MSKLVIGAVERGDLPELGITDLQLRVDTGAKTSSMHADNIRRFKHNGKTWIKFDIHPDAYNVGTIVECQSKLHDIRTIKSSNGASEERYVIKTQLKLGSDTWPIEITLSDRSDMSYLMLLGREGMSDRVLVDPSQTFMLENNEVINPAPL